VLSLLLCLWSTAFYTWSHWPKSTNRFIQWGPLLEACRPVCRLHTKPRRPCPCLSWLTLSSGTYLVYTVFGQALMEVCLRSCYRVSQSPPTSVVLLTCLCSWSSEENKLLPLNILRILFQTIIFSNTSLFMSVYMWVLDHQRVAQLPMTCF